MLRINLQVKLTTGDHAHIEADNVAEAYNALQFFGNLGVLRTSPDAPDTAADECGDGAQTEASAPATAPEKAAEKPKRGRKPAAETKTTPEPSAPTAGTAEPASDRVSAPPAEPAKAKPKAKPEDVTAAVTNLANATSLITARDVLKAFGVARAGDLKPEQYDDFVAACEAKMKEAVQGDANA